MGPATSSTCASGKTTIAMGRSAMPVEILERPSQAVALLEQARELRIAARDGLRIGLDLFVQAREPRLDLGTLGLRTLHGILPVGRCRIVARAARGLGTSIPLFLPSCQTVNSQGKTAGIRCICNHPRASLDDGPEDPRLVPPARLRLHLRQPA